MNLVKTEANTKTSSTAISTKVSQGKFAKVYDGRKQAIRGLRIRNGRSYAQLKIENPITGETKVRRVLLETVKDIAGITDAIEVAGLNAVLGAGGHQANHLLSVQISGDESKPSDRCRD